MVSFATSGQTSEQAAEDATSHDEAGWNWRLVLSLTAIVLVLELLTISYIMVSTALPAISRHFGTDQGAWLMTAFLLVGAVTAPLLGKLADMHGKRKMLLACIGFAIIGSLLSATATSYAVMIAGRGLAGFLVPCLFLSYSLIRDVFPPRTVALSVSLATSGAGLIAIPAPFLSGWLLDDFGWRSIFWFFLIVLVILFFGLIGTTEESSIRLRATIDLIGAALLGLGIAGILVGVSFGPSWGWTAFSTLTYLIGGIALIGAWLGTAATFTNPLIDITVLRHRPVVLTAVAGGCIYGISGLIAMIIPMMMMTPASLQLGYGFGLSAKQLALYQSPMGAFTMLGGVIVGLLVGRNIAKPRQTVAAAMLIAALGCLLLAVSHDSKGLIALFVGVVGLGLGLGFSSVPNLLIEAVPPQLQGSSASLVAAFQSLMPAIMPVIVFAVLNNSYVAQLPAQVMSMMHGSVLYTNDGFTTAFLIAAVPGIIGFIAAVALPRRIDQLSLDTVVASR